MEHPNKIKWLSQGALVVAAFCLLVSLLLLVNFWQTRRVNPLDNKAIAVLTERLKDDPMNEELKKEIRMLDLVARKAYFTSEWQVTTGSFLLLAGAIALIVFLKMRKDLTDKIERPDDSKENLYVARFLARRWVLIVAFTIFASSLLASFLTTDYLSKYGDPEFIAAQEQKAIPNDATEEVETVSLQPVEGEEPGLLPATPDTTADDRSDEIPGQARDDMGVQKLEGDPGSSPGMTANARDDVGEEPGLLPVNQPPATSNQSPSFRGRWGSAFSPAVGLPVSWDGKSGKNILWKTELKKPGFNSPIFWGDKLFISGGNGEGLAVYCYKRESGELLWEQAVKDVPGSPPAMPKTTDDTGLAAPTMCTDGQRVCAIFANGDLIAFDMHGARLWARNLGVPDNHYGHSSSLVTHQGKLIVLYDTNKGGRLLAIDIKTGDIIYDIKRKSKISWASPVLAEINGKIQILTSSAPTVAGHDFETGAELWSVDCLMGEVGPSPAYGNGLVFAANEYARLVAIRPGPTPEIVWEDDEYLPEVSSLAWYDGLLYLATSYGMVVCYDAQTGEKMWEDDSGQPFYGSPMVADGKMYIVDMPGVVHIYKAGRSLEKIGTAPLGDKSVATPAFADGRIYLKSYKYLYAIGEK